MEMAGCRGLNEMVVFAIVGGELCSGSKKSQIQETKTIQLVEHVKIEEGNVANVSGWGHSKLGTHLV
jgi:hypothetical protein